MKLEITRFVAKTCAGAILSITLMAGLVAGTEHIVTHMRLPWWVTPMSLVGIWFVLWLMAAFVADVRDARKVDRE